MPAESLLALEEARDRWKAAPPGPGKQALLEEYLEAEKEHDKRLGIPLSTNPLTKTILPLALVLLLVVGSYLAIATNLDLDDLVDQLDQDAYETCLRGNDARQAAVANLRNDVQNLRADQTNLRGDIDYLHANPSPGSDDLLQTKRDALVSKERSIEKKKQAITEYVAAQAPAAIHPGSVRVVC